MIDWWGWILILVGLVLLLVGMLALMAWRLFRKGLRLLDDVGELAARAGVLAGVDDTVNVRPAIAVLAEMSDIRAREEARAFHRRERRRLRHDRRMARAKRITSVDASRAPWPADWYR
jgi:hypothetical protein